MLLFDVNVLVYSYREDAPDHSAYRSWLKDVVESGEPFGVADIVLSGFLRITTHPKIFKPPSPFESAMEFVAALRSQPNCTVVAPGPNHWQIFTDLCQVTGAHGNLIPDAYLAALAIEADLEWITTDSGFSRYPGLRFRHPLGTSQSPRPPAG